MPAPQMLNRVVLTLVAAGVLVLIAGVIFMKSRSRGPGEPVDDAKIQMVSPGDLLYSTPTLADALPATATGAVPPNAVVIFEDDWRQIEFVDAAGRTASREQLRALHDFKAKHRKGEAWDDVFVRKGRDEALSPMNIPFSSVAPLLAKAPRRPLALSTLGRPVLVRDGFAAQLSRGIVLYGQERNGTLLSLGLELNEAQPDFASIEASLQSLCDRANLDLVDWYGERIVLEAAGSPK